MRQPRPPRRRPTKATARELIEKLEGLSLDAEHQLLRLEETRPAGESLLERAVAEERAANYAHAVELARNLLGITS